MSEVTPNELVEDITLTVSEASVVPAPVDPTLTIPGEAADAKATGDAIAGVIGGLRINSKSPSGGSITLYAGDIYMNNEEGAQTIAAAIESAGDKDADDIIYDETNLISVKGAIDAINTELESELSEADIDGIFDEVFGGGDE